MPPERSAQRCPKPRSSSFPLTLRWSRRLTCWQAVSAAATSSRAASPTSTSFRSDHYADVSLSQWMGVLPPELVEAHLNLPDDVIADLPRSKP